MKNLKLSNTRSVSFNVRNFCVPVKRSRTLKHVIHAAKNIGFTARPNGLKGTSHGISRLSLPSSININETVMRIVNTVDGGTVKRVFCYSMRNGGNITNALITVTEYGAYYTPLFGLFPITPLPNGFTTAESFELGYTRSRHHVFAINENGLFAATNMLSFSQIALDGKPSKMKVHDGRLFVLDKDAFKIHFSAASDMLDFGTETGLAGSIQINENLGEIIDMQEFQGKLLLVHRNGFSTLTSAYVPKDFVLQSLAPTYEEIIPNTIATLGNTVYFLTKEGLCSFENGKVKLLDVEGDFSSTQPHAVSIVYDNRYYLAYRSSKSGENNDTVLVVDKFFDSYTLIKNVTVRDFLHVWNQHISRLGVLTNDLINVYQLNDPSGTQSPKRWESDWFALTYASTAQFVKQVLIKTAHPITLLVANNRSEQRISVNGSPDVQKINLNMRGEVFKVALESNNREADVTSLTVVVGFNSGGGN